MAGENNLQASRDEKIRAILNPRRSIALKIGSELDALPDFYMVLMLVKPERYQDVSVELTRYFVEDQKLSGLYVTLNKPYADVADNFLSERINTDNIRFIDGISKLTGRNMPIGRNIEFVDSPQALAQITSAMQQFLSMGGESRFLVFDSMSTLLVYYDIEPVGKFAHFMIGMIRKWKLKGVMLMIESEEKRGAIDMLSLFCDKVIKVN